MCSIVLRTHGGLGNQLFQVFYGRLISEQFKLDLREVHDLNYKHKFNRCEVPAISPAPAFLQAAVSSLRVPKVLERLLGRQESPLKIGQNWYLDGYFQKKILYENFSQTTIRKNLKTIANELNIRPADDDTLLVHLRVGDFFNNQKAATQHILERIMNIPDQSALMTNDEELLDEDNIFKLIKSKQARLISTKNTSAQNVLRAISRHRKVDANDSTLVFWAHVLSGTQADFKSEKLSSLAKYLGQFGPWRYSN
jgi:hypothetical protein